MTARQALELGTLGGAAVLGRTDLGSLEIGKCADFIAYDLSQLEYTGALHDPLAALLFCTPTKVAYSVVGGKVIVTQGELTTLDLPKQIEEHNLTAKKLLNP